MSRGDPAKVHLSVFSVPWGTMGPHCSAWLLGVVGASEGPSTA